MNKNLECLAEDWKRTWDERADLYEYLVQKAELKRAEVVILERLVTVAGQEANAIRRIEQAGFFVGRGNAVYVGSLGGELDERVGGFQQ